MNVLWIVVDTLRADRLGCYGYFRNTSPTLDRLTQEGVLFEGFQASGISTGAAFTCLFTGLPSIVHRYYATPARAFNLVDFDDTIPTLPEIVQSPSEGDPPLRASATAAHDAESACAALKLESARSARNV